MAIQTSTDVLERAHRAVNEFPPQKDGSFSLGASKVLDRYGLLGLTIPAEYGGFGADSLVQSQVLWVTSRACPSIGLWLAMHTTVMMFIAALGSDEQKKRLFAEVVKQGKLFAAATSEPNASFKDVFEMRTRFIPVDGGYAINGEKHFCSIGRWAHRYFVMGKLQGSSSARTGAITAAVQRGPGIDISVWDYKRPLGMQETASDSIRFKNVIVPVADVIGEPGELLGSGLFANFAICYAAVYGAIAESALEHTQEYLSTKELPSTRTEYNQGVLESLEARVDAVKRLIREACSAFASDRANAVLPIARAKLTACDTSMEAVQEMMQLVGGASIFEAQSPHGRWLREAAVGLVMPPSQTRCREVIDRIKSGEKGVTLLEFL